MLAVLAIGPAVAASRRRELLFALEIRQDRKADLAP